MKSFTRFLLSILAVSLLITFSVSCNRDDTVYPKIKQISANPDTINIHETTAIIVDIFDKDKFEEDDLVFYYSCKSGLVKGNGDTACWTAPDKYGNYKITVLISDYKGNSDIDSVQVHVKQPEATFAVNGIAAFPCDSLLDLRNANAMLYNSIENFRKNIPQYVEPCQGLGPIVYFNFPLVAAGKYYLAVWKDVDGNSIINIGDYYGWYGTGEINGSEPPNPYVIDLTDDNAFNKNVRMWVK